VDQIKSQVDRLSELSDEQVTELQSAIVSEFEMVETQDTTAETVDAMTSLADMLDTVRGEVQRREAAAQELANRAAEATMRVKGEGEDMTGDLPMEDMPAEGEAPAEEAPAEDMPEETPTEMPAEEPGQVEKGSAEDEVGETPEEEDTEKKKKSSDSTYSVESIEASAVAVEGSELSTPTETEAAETVAEVASIEEAVELSVEGEEEAPAEVVETPAEAPEAPAEAVEASNETVEVSEVSGEFSTDENQIETTIAQNEQEEQAPVTAAAEQPFEAPADRQPVLQVTEAPVAITAGADIPGYTAGSPIDSIQDVAVAMEKRLHSLRRVNGGDGEQHIVASFTTQYPESRTLTTDSESNAQKIAAVAGPEALVASGGHSTPFEVKYDIFGIGSTTVRPVRDALPRFQADRGGIRFITPPTLVRYSSGTVYDYDSAVGVWTAANDSATTPSPSTKNSLTVSAASENTVSTDAVTLQLQFGNLMTRAYPELIARHNELALVQHAREAELNLISKIGTASTAVNAHVATTEAASLIGFARDFLVQIRKAAVAYRSRHRIDAGTQLKAIVPAWIFDAMAADLALNMPGDGNLGVGEAEIKGYLAGSNVTLVPSVDLNSFGAQAGSAAKLLEFPDQITWYLFAEGTFLFLDGGTLDLGIIRDSTLVGTNDYKMFVETFENVAFVGIESLAITSSLSINGVAAALRDTTGGATAAAIEE
jgi:chemotaxis protein histidine kinase CheA